MSGTPELPTLFVDRPLPDGFDELFVGRANVVGPDISALPFADGVLAGAVRWDAEQIDKASDRLRVISRCGIGYDSVDLDAATARGVVVTNAPDAPTVSTAEHAVALMMVASKRLAVSQRRLRDGSGDYVTENAAIELDGQTLGLVGYGRIARRVGTVGAALGMSVIAHDPYLERADVELVEFEELLARADVVSVHTPLSDATRHLFGREVFERMRDGVILVNTSRGGVIDQDALSEALDRGKVGAAGLDVTEPEPLAPDHPLLGRDDVFVTPHIASSTTQGKRRLYQHGLDNALVVLAGQRCATCVNPEVYDG